jgi:hypothetical protein
MYSIIISGIVSKESLLILKAGLKRNYMKNLTLDFFCLYSEYEIPIGSLFTNFSDINTDFSMKLTGILVDVTQAWAKPFNSIPKGHKTLARIQFNDEDTIAKITSLVPIVNRWEESDFYFSLSGSDV